MIKRITIILFSIMLGCNIQAITVSKQLDSVLAECYNQLNTTSTQSRNYSTTVMKRFVNRAYGIVCEDFPVISKVDTVVVSKSSIAGSLPSDFDRETIVLKIAGDSLRLPMTPISKDSLYRFFPDKTTNTQDRSDTYSPKHYYIEGDLLLLHPKLFTDTPDSFEVFYYADGSKLTAGTDTVLINSSKYMEALIYKACELATSKYNDKTSGAEFHRLYEALK